MNKAKNYLNSIPDTIDPESIYPDALELLAAENIFAPLNGESYLSFHEKLMEISSCKHGVGIAVAIMAQLNIAGVVLEKAAETNEPAKKLLEGIISGKNVISLGVSEKNWNGRISTLKSSVSANSKGDTVLNAEKSFLTNGYHASHYLIVARNEITEKFSVVITQKNEPGINIEKFTLPFAKEATHCRLECKNLIINQEQILDVDYKGIAENLRMSEMLSLAVAFCGYSKYLLTGIFKDRELNELISGSEDFKSTILDLHTLRDLLWSNLRELSGKKDGNRDILLVEYYPFGFESVARIFFEALFKIFGKDKITQLSPDSGLFFWRDKLQESYLHRARKRMMILYKDSDSPLPG
ncbi:MAG: acyl-CoA/acyl-ACP dehydrogenase [Leptospira sp.]|nr:acyl-CoA/acyl-ACP dehydrogenase [Leptospira sp.]